MIWFDLKWYVKPENKLSGFRSMHIGHNMLLESTHIRAPNHNGIQGAFVSHWYIDLAIGKSFIFVFFI